jgi:hemolysin III
MNVVAVKRYSPAEEMVNIGSHGLGVMVGLVALGLMLARALPEGDSVRIFSVALFGVSLVLTYSMSTIYHSCVEPVRRSRMRVMDHTSIYVLIAGTYTPFTLITLEGPIGWGMFAATWTMAALGITLKWFFTGRYSRLSTAMYVFMGWVIVFAIAPLKANLAAEGLSWLVAGGLAYTTGAIIYGIKKIPFNHAIFHVFTLLGSVCHITAVYCYVQ